MAKRLRLFVAAALVAAFTLAVAGCGGDDDGGGGEQVSGSLSISGITVTSADSRSGPTRNWMAIGSKKRRQFCW